ncbi:MAG: cell division ATP-binding protein FtsE [Nitrospinota bacterium]
MIEVFHLYKSYGKGVYALWDISFQVRAGEFVFITGPSGAGKTTLLKILFAAEQPDRGQVLVAGRNIWRLHRRQIPRLRRQIGFVFQDFKLLPRRTVFENVAFCQRVVGVHPKDIKRRVWNVLKMVGLTHKRDLHVELLSGGEQQRVAIARALVNGPPLLLADEPTGNLDPELSREVMNLFKVANREDTTVLVATHDRELVEKMGERAISLERGKIIEG